MISLISITNIVGGTSLFLNFSLLLLIFFHLPSHLGSFKINYYGMTIVDTLFTLAQLIAAPCFFSDGDAYFIFSSHHWGTLPIVFFMFLHNTSFISISYNFLSRYSMVCNNSSTKLLEGKWTRRTIRFLNVSEIFLSLSAVIIIFHIPEWAKKGLNDRYSELLKMDFESDFILGSTLEMFPVCGPYAEILRMSSFIVFIIFGLFNMSITFLCGIGMYTYIRKQSSSRKLRTVNYRLLIILTTQASMSSLFVYTPGLITALFTILHYDGSNLSQPISSLMSFATLFTPSIVILLTKEYRSKFLSFLRCFPQRTVTSSIDAVGNNRSISTRYS